MNYYADAGWGVGGMSGLAIASQLSETKYKDGVAATNAALQRFYRDVVFRQMVDVIRFTYLKSWDAGPVRFALPTGGEETTYKPRAVRPGTSLTNKELTRAVGDNVLE